MLDLQWILMFISHLQKVQPCLSISRKSQESSSINQHTSIKSMTSNVSSFRTFPTDFRQKIPWISQGPRAKEKLALLPEGLRPVREVRCLAPLLVSPDPQAKDLPPSDFAAGMSFEHFSGKNGLVTENVGLIFPMIASHLKTG